VGVGVGVVVGGGGTGGGGLEGVVVGGGGTGGGVVVAGGPAPRLCGSDTVAGGEAGCATVTGVTSVGEIAATCGGAVRRGGLAIVGA